MAEINQKQLDYIKDYNKNHYVVIRVQVNKVTEPELLDHLKKKDNKSGYIKGLILDDMKK
jgi:ribosomal protein S6